MVTARVQAQVVTGTNELAATRKQPWNMHAFPLQTPMLRVAFSFF